MKNKLEFIDEWRKNQQEFIDNWIKSTRDFQNYFKQNDSVKTSGDLINQSMNYFTKFNKDWDAALHEDSQAELRKIFFNYIQTIFSSVMRNENFDQKNNSHFSTILEQLLQLSFPFQELNKYSMPWDVFNKYYLLINSIHKITSLMNEGAITAFHKSATSYNSQMNSDKTKRFDYNILVNEWTRIMENVFISIFSSAEFSKTKADIIHHSLDIKKALDNQIEHHLKDSPFILRAEMDDLYKTIYDLNKKIKKIEQKLESALN